MMKKIFLMVVGIFIVSMSYSQYNKYYLNIAPQLKTFILSPNISSNTSYNNLNRNIYRMNTYLLKNKYYFNVKKYHWDYYNGRAEWCNIKKYNKVIWIIK